MAPGDFSARISFTSSVSLSVSERRKGARATMTPVAGAAEAAGEGPPLEVKGLGDSGQAAKARQASMARKASFFMSFILWRA